MSGKPIRDLFGIDPNSYEPFAALCKKAILSMNAERPKQFRNDEDTLFELAGGLPSVPFIQGRCVHMMVSQGASLNDIRKIIAMLFPKFEEDTFATSMLSLEYARTLDREIANGSLKLSVVREARE